MCNIFNSFQEYCCVCKNWNGKFERHWCSTRHSDCHHGSTNCKFVKDPDREYNEEDFYITDDSYDD